MESDELEVPATSTWRPAKPQTGMITNVFAFGFIFVTIYGLHEEYPASKLGNQ